MTKVFAIFSDETALDGFMSSLDKGDYEILAPQGEPVPQEKTSVVAAPMNSNSPVGLMVPIGETVLVSGYTLEQEMQDKGLPEEESRMFADALRGGSHVLIVQHATDHTAEQLRQAGADHVSPN